MFMFLDSQNASSPFQQPVGKAPSRSGQVNPQIWEVQGGTGGSLGGEAFKAEPLGTAAGWTLQGGTPEPQSGNPLNPKCRRTLTVCTFFFQS